MLVLVFAPECAWVASKNQALSVHVKREEPWGRAENGDFKFFLFFFFFFFFFCSSLTRAPLGFICVRFGVDLHSKIHTKFYSGKIVLLPNTFLEQR